MAWLRFEGDFTHAGTPPTNWRWEFRFDSNTSQGHDGSGGAAFGKVEMITDGETFAIWHHSVKDAHDRSLPDSLTWLKVGAGKSATGFCLGGSSIPTKVEGSLVTED
jgi:hypothetical protein